MHTTGTARRYPPDANVPDDERSWTGSTTPTSRRRRTARCTVSFANPHDAANDRIDTSAINTPSPVSVACCIISSSTTQPDGPTNRRNSCAAGPNVIAHRASRVGSAVNGGPLNGYLRITQPHHPPRRRQLRQRPPRHPQALAPETDHRQPRRTTRRQILAGQLIAKRPTDPQHLDRLRQRQQRMLINRSDLPDVLQ